MTAKARFFVALGVPAEAGIRLAGIPRAGIDGHWNHPDDLHITLRFLGDIDPARIPEIREALARVRRPPFGVEVGGLGFFDQKRGAVLYARVDSTRKLNALCGDITDMLAPLGFDFGMREFVPHITLARLRTRHGLSQYIEKQEKNVVLRWEAAAFGLMQSVPPDTVGRHYRTLDRYPLIPLR